ncbi:DinB family protein [Paenibacillus sp. BK033]|uniref:DinB family protein n=1 Tax=Paenibacillus sp. BK033 TaxID=2512133 RepID=UPI00104F4AF6|nr:DinB family protein [Paenibacillus sp. BK033]TCM95887.1 DinB family protein [Paenibacillus sp. BK033]
MSKGLLHQLGFVRQVTLNAVRGLPEAVLDVVPEGFNNNMRWNLGHIYVVQERFAFHFAGEPVLLPDSFERWFAKGTKPGDWQEEQLPKLDTLLELLAAQPIRIAEKLHDRLEEQTAMPFTTGTGVPLHTVGEFLSYTLYHEGIHFNSISLLKRFAANGR